MTWPAVFLWLLIMIGSFSRGPLILYLFTTTVIFGGLTMAPANLVGGLNLPAQTICAAILIIKICLHSDNLIVLLRQSLDLRKLGLLGFFLIYFVITSFLYPSLFQGDLMLYSLNAAATESPLMPTSANFTQTMYLLTSVSVTFVFSVAARNIYFRDLYMKSILIAAIFLVASGAIDLSLNASGALNLLEPFHNATYKSLDTVSLAGQYRVVGFMPEASDYGVTTCTFLSLLVFNYQFFTVRYKPYIICSLIFMLAMMTVLSTSSTAYLGLIVLIGLILLRFVVNALLVPVRSQNQVQKLVYIIILALTCTIILILFGPAIFAKYQNLFNVVLFDKSASSSYQERMRWSEAGLRAFFDTYGIGVGVGSVRTSNWFINILSSTGVLGVSLFFAFIIKLFLPRSLSARSNGNLRFSNALKLSVIPPAIMIGVSGTTPDPGVWVMAIFGMLYALQSQPQAKTANLEKVYSKTLGKTADNGLT